MNKGMGNMLQLSHAETLSDALITDPAVPEEMLIQKSEHKWVPVFFEQPSPLSWLFLLYFLIFLCFFSLTSCHKNISSLRAGTSLLCLPLSSYSLAHGRCSEICVEEVNE